MSEMYGKVCLVTGGAMGLGAATARLLALKGASVIIADIDRRGCELALDLGENVDFINHDVTSEESWAAVLETVQKKWGDVQILINNAGIVEKNDIESCSLESWRRVLDVSLTGSFLGSRAVISSLRKSGRAGSIVNMASTAAVLGLPSIPSYSAAKAAVCALTRSIAAHCIQERLPIRCNAIAPGTIDTPMVRGAIGGAPLDDSKSSPIRSAGSPNDVAHMILYLVSGNAQMVNGATLMLDGGLSILETEHPNWTVLP